MSGLAAIFNLDGQPADFRLLQRMTDRIVHRGPDRQGHWVQGSVGLAQAMLSTTPHSLQERQPWSDESGSLWVVLDGRVDNRSELRARLARKGVNPRRDTDAELILKAYECWGADCPIHIIGDFAFVIWDSRNRQLFCARDHMGIRPFYYYLDHRVFLCGSELRQLFEHPAVRLDPNEGMIGEYLANDITSQEDTLYRAVSRLPPAHVLLVSSAGIRKARYWNVDLLRELRYQTDDAYAEHFLELFQEAVRCRLDSLGPVGADLSGGLDSSSIVGIAQTLLRRGAAPDLGFETFSLIFPGLDCDESGYQDDVVRMCGVTSNRSLPAYPTRLGIIEQINRSMDMPDYPNQTMSDPLAVAARDKGIKVILTGLGGDEWLSEGIPPYADLLREGKLFSLVKEVSQDTDGLGIAGAARLILTLMLPRRLRRAYRRAMGRDGGPPWLAATYARRICLAERLNAEPDIRPINSYTQRDIYLTSLSGSQSHSYEMAERSSSWFGLESRHPFNDRRLNECVLALPQEQRCRGGQIKYILRQAMRDRLPESVRNRVTKAHFSHTFVHAMQEIVSETILNRSELESLGWVDGVEVRRMYHRMMEQYQAGDQDYAPMTWSLWMIMGIELWLKTVVLRKTAWPQEEHAPALSLAAGRDMP